ncbi:MAG: YqaA family protein [Succinivibrionaceae bacterium]
MKIFTSIYDKCIALAKHRFATIFLMINSFIESIFWPIPVDAMLIPMSLASPNKAYKYAFYATVSSVCGAIIGYYLGYFLYDAFLEELIIKLGWMGQVDKVNKYLVEIGIIFIIIGSFTPVPYKVVAICCGVAASQQMLADSSWQLNIIPFIIVSFIGRGARFFLISGLIRFGGEKMANKIRQYIDIIGWIVIFISIIGICWYIYYR